MRRSQTLGIVPWGIIVVVLRWTRQAFEVGGRFQFLNFLPDITHITKIADFYETLLFFFSVYYITRRIALWGEPWTAHSVFVDGNEVVPFRDVKDLWLLAKQCTVTQ